MAPDNYSYKVVHVNDICGGYTLVKLRFSNQELDICSVVPSGISPYVHAQDLLKTHYRKAFVDSVIESICNRREEQSFSTRAAQYLELMTRREH
ncbi:hypothetical protein AB4254_11895 [Vibrio breoganii]